ncbi:helix-turn-helix transcriptional regulator [Sulfuriroseicoccus oceanibius]|uniref:Uncharacterized protein n=1 Tax=Sulfuriroseicoccus oceanibius TaxID=2707525 RepID=A0A6B3L7K4_9BACT|nr:LuxR C-terminal-related transcriptional regulator [Sulfuriroseicoccus oceanibius]QQL44274.1 hypothetical protein G3M56_010265 [Sulfuriroseicoccus oceanibius]
MPHLPPPQLNENDIRSIVRLLGQVAVEGNCLREKRKLLMTGLISLIDADSWAWGVYANETPGELQQPSLLMYDGFTPDEFGAFAIAQNHPDMARLSAPFMEDCRQSDGRVTRLRQQVDPENTFPNSEAYHLWRAANVDPLILSSKLNRSGQRGVIGIYRKFGRPLFNERELRITHIVLTEVSWLHEESCQKIPTEAVSCLSPRLNTIHNLLLAGQTRKQIAHELSISINTVHSYIKELYQRFEVHSQAELIRRFIQGDGGDGL